MAADRLLVLCKGDNVNIWRELGRLQVEAEGTPVADGIAAVRRVLILDQARRRGGVKLDQDRHEAALGERVRLHPLMVRGRIARVPGKVVPLLKALAAAGEVALDREELATRIYGAASPNLCNRISEHGGVLQSVLRIHDYGLLLHRDQANGYTLLSEPLTLAQAQEVRDAAS